MAMDPNNWLLASRKLQNKLAPQMPDPIEVVWGVPRVMIRPLADAVVLASRSEAVGDQDPTMKEDIEFAAQSLRTQLEQVWPARLDSRLDSRRVQYGAVSSILGVNTDMISNCYASH